MKERIRESRGIICRLSVEFDRLRQADCGGLDDSRRMSGMDLRGSLARHCVILVCTTVSRLGRQVCAVQRGGAVEEAPGALLSKQKRASERDYSMCRGVVLIINGVYSELMGGGGDPYGECRSCLFARRSCRSCVNNKNV